MMSSPLPKPNILDEPLTFSTKKARSTPRFRPPPRPPAKTCPPMSRVFKRRPSDLLGKQAQSVTFKDSPDGSLTGTPLPATAVYDATRRASYYEQTFGVEEKLGAGYFGTVYRVRNKVDGRKYAVKIANERYRGTGDRARKLDEVRKHEILLPHPNCVHFYQSWEEDSRLYQQFELCQMSLAQLSERKHDIAERTVWAYLVDLLHALQHLHDNELIHMDVKPENIFIGRDGLCKLGDFGLVLDLSKENEAVFNSQGTIGGDSKYMASEILEGTYTKACDVFSLGVTILELATDLDLPNGGYLWHALREEGPDPMLCKDLSPDLRKTLKLMMGRDHERRPTVGQLLQLQSVTSAASARRSRLKMAKLKSAVMSFIAPVIVFLAHFLTLVILDPAGTAWGRVRRSPPVTALFARLGLAGGGEGRDESAMRTPPMPQPEERRSETGAPAGATSSSDDEDFDLSHCSSNHSLLASPLENGDSSPDRSFIKPVSLAAKFDYYSTDGSDFE